ncbi:pantothenate kinase [Saprolegnia diclina VS20]|uniref:pantothenate kinase n=1 Tax=Saprolegnia diclina (strain VS20) TaxID=1156394 RepID=T0SB08_SAPDV|nr:pantothenate kinase [Saprolegnia diclina VS20]EQC42548.1 pantothenate kinase [Saprolegnia diclina VS20]|eukprot:XP_008603971.1 pantothenate kinase [Saprolegnia diclina VS20]
MLARFALATVVVVGLVVLRKRKLQRLQARIIYHRDKDLGRRFGMDVGGTLGKLVYLERDPSELGDVHTYIMASTTYGKSANREDGMALQLASGRIHFLRFETTKLEKVVEFVRHRCFHRDIRTMPCTGGGAFKFSKLFEDNVGITLEKCDELACLIQGLGFVMRHVPDECYTFKNVAMNHQGMGEATKTIVHTPTSELYPFLLVNIGSGVSILKVTSETEYTRVSGTSLGGGTYLGLCKLLSKYRSFDEAMDASIVGDSNTVDMTVGDIYGGNYTQFNLSANTLASSFGKMGTKYEPKSGVRDEDVARSLLIMITTNIGQVAYLSAQRSDTQRIYFCGNFLRQNEIASRQLAYAIDYWSKSQMQAQFFHHEGFFGALGALLTHNQDLLAL